MAISLDFFTPLVDDPRDFGAVAAANAFSDLYAMGARPVLALNILAVPADELDEEVVGAILEGAAEVCEEAGVPMAGGHSIDDPEPKFGLVALGEVDPDRMWRKAGGRPGDRLVLGKALGTGVITTAIKSGVAPDGVVEAAVASMRQLNAAAMEILRDHEPRAVTDVSGFGLLGHLREMTRASEVGGRIRAGSVPLLPGARELAEEGCVPGGTRRNRRSLEGVVSWDDGIAESVRTLLCDAQTSGGLLAAVPPPEADAVAGAWREAGYRAAVVGELTKSETGRIRVEDG